MICAEFIQRSCLYFILNLLDIQNSYLRNCVIFTVISAWSHFYVFRKCSISYFVILLCIFYCNLLESMQLPTDFKISILCFYRTCEDSKSISISKFCLCFFLFCVIMQLFF